MKIEVKSETTTNEKTNNGNIIRKQQCALITGGDYPLPFYVVVDQPYPPGIYELAPESFRINQYQGLELDRYKLRLQPVK